jgi:CBS domain-containing protein
MEPNYRIHVSDLVLENVVCVPPPLTLKEAARLLAMTGVGTLVVDTQPLTELTERDVVRALALGATGDTPVFDVVRGTPDFVRADALFEDAAGLLLDTSRPSVVVVEEGRPVGVLSLPTVIAALSGGVSWIAALRSALRVETVF